VIGVPSGACQGGVPTALAGFRTGCGRPATGTGEDGLAGFCDIEPGEAVTHTWAFTCSMIDSLIRSWSHIGERFRFDRAFASLAGLF
jgi:hypothetical protein